MAVDGKTISSSSIDSIDTKSTSSTESSSTSFIPFSKPLKSNALFGSIASFALFLIVICTINSYDTSNATKLGLMIPSTIILLIALYQVQKAEFHEVQDQDVIDSKQHPPPGYIYREQDGRTVLVKAFHPPKSNRKVLGRPIPMSEVNKHNTLSSCWVVIESRVYDITPYVTSHPGGWLPIKDMAGLDCTDAFANYHPATVYEKLLPGFYIGDCPDAIDSDFIRGHRSIRQELLRRGLFNTNSSFYYLKIMWFLLLFLSAVFFTLTTRPLLGACLMAGFWQQLAFLGHDIGHNAIFHSKSLDTMFGVVFGNTLGGISLGWWKRSHNVHHVVCNSIEHDPDIQHMPIFAVDPGIVDQRELREAGTLGPDGGFWSTYHEKWIRPDAASRLLVGAQHYLFYPVMMVARFNLYIQGFIFVATSWKQDAWWAKRFQKLEFVTLSLFLTWLTLLVSSLPTWSLRLQWLLVSHALAGVLHVQICISHFTMSTYHDRAYSGHDDDWFRMQLATTMNVWCPRWMDWAHGGLQFQIEHHLFPRLPRHNLREARSLVKPFCSVHNVHYHEVPFLSANAELVRGLRDAAGRCRRMGLEAVGGLKGTQIWEGLNAEG